MFSVESICPNTIDSFFIDGNLTTEKYLRSLQKSVISQISKYYERDKLQVENISIR